MTANDYLKPLSRDSPAQPGKQEIFRSEKFLMRKYMKKFKTAITMKGMMAAVVALLAIACFSSAAKAAGTPAGTIILNQATANFEVDGDPTSSNSNIVSIQVGEILNVDVTWQDASAIPVFPGSLKQVLTMKVTNTGNGNEAFSLAVNTALPGDQFDPSIVSVYLDTDENGLFDESQDTLYTPGANDPDMPADGFVTVFILCDIPADRLADDLGDADLTATSKTGSGTPGTIFEGLGDGGTDAVVGSTTATMTTPGTYEVRNVIVTIVKSAVVQDQFGGNKAIPGATVIYTLSVAASGEGTAQGVVITDDIPENSTYIPGTLKLNGAPLSDAADADAGDEGATTAGTVTVSLGDMIDTTPAQTIEFSVLIN